MALIKCFNAVADALDEVDENFTWAPDPERIDLFFRCCEGIDVLVEEFKGELYEVKVDDTAMIISISLECNDVFLQTKNHLLYDIAEEAIELSFSKVSKDSRNVLITFIFPCVWRKV